MENQRPGTKFYLFTFSFLLLTSPKNTTVKDDDNLYSKLPLPTNKQTNNEIISFERRNGDTLRFWWHLSLQVYSRFPPFLALGVRDSEWVCGRGPSLHAQTTGDDREKTVSACGLVPPGPSRWRFTRRVTSTLTRQNVFAWTLLSLRITYWQFFCLGYFIETQRRKYGDIT